MARNYRDDEYNDNSPAFGDEEYIDYDDEPAAEDSEYTEDDWSEDESAEGEYAGDENSEEEYEDEEYAEDEYSEEPDYDDEGEEFYDEEQPAEEEYDDGSGYSIFKRLNRENSRGESDDADEEEDYAESEDEYYDEDAVDEDTGSDEDDSYNGEKGGKLTAFIDRLAALTDNDIIMYVLLAVLPPVGLLLMFYTGRWDVRKRTICLVASLICLLIWILLLLPSGSSNDVVSNGDDFGFNQFTAVPTNKVSTVPGFATVTPVPGVEEATPVPSTTVHTVAEATDQAGMTYVYATNSGVYYHTLSDCGGITNASRITIDAAIGRNLSACPDCAGGNNGTTDPSDASTTYYATSGGKYYHVTANCSGMTNASITTLSAATLAGKTACPVCIGYYGTPNGQYYHVISNCSGMTNAVVKTQTEWTSTGKTACPICMGDGKSVTGNAVPTETQVFATTKGTYFHTKSDCSGMKNASQSTISRAVNMGKTACPTCVKPANIYVFATQNGQYYHTISTCSGMKNAQYITVSNAIKYGKTACPTCAKMLTGVKGFTTTASSSTTATTTTSTTSATATYVYCTTGGTYFHTESGCSGMTGAKKVTYANAVSAGKKACPTCVKASKITVFCTSGGTYFHTNATCSGMTGATAMTAQKAIGYGKKACTTCAKALKSVSAGNSSTQVAYASTGVTIPVWSNLSSQGSVSASAGSTVYIDLSGSDFCYHLIAKCPIMNFYDGHAVTLEYAIGCGYNSCPACNPPANITV